MGREPVAHGKDAAGGEFGEVGSLHTVAGGVHEEVASAVEVEDDHVGFDFRH